MMDIRTDKSQTAKHVSWPEDTKKLFEWRIALVFIVGLFLILAFLNVFATNPSITSYSVVTENEAAPGRFANATSLLIVIFAFFALFIFIITRKLTQYRSQK